MHSTNIKDSYRIELKERILKTAYSLFCKHGIRQEKMDDIASELKISKRTLYEVYRNKEELLFEVVQRDDELKRKMLMKVEESEATVMDIIIELYRQKTEELSKINPVIPEEMHKYPRVLEYIREKREWKRRKLMKFVKRGIDEGYFLPSVDYDIATVLLDGAGEFVMGNRLYRKYDFKKIFKTTLYLYIRGICTPKGVEELDDFLATL